MPRDWLLLEVQRVRESQAPWELPQLGLDSSHLRRLELLVLMALLVLLEELLGWIIGLSLNQYSQRQRKLSIGPRQGNWRSKQYQRQASGENISTIAKLDFVAFTHDHVLNSSKFQRKVR